MQERRERVEKWRQAQKPTLEVGGAALAASGADGAAAVDGSTPAEGADSAVPVNQSEGDGEAQNGAPAESGTTNQKKKWTLDDDELLTGEYDDDDDDEEENGVVPMDDDEDEANSLNLPQRRTEDAAGDEDKIEKVVSNGKF